MKFRSSFKRLGKTAAAIAIYLGTLGSMHQAQAGFLDDYYNSAGANANVTPAQAYSTQSMSVVTGGGLVWKTPNRNFNAVMFTPPSLSAGCGGIDMFLGAFGLASKEQFIAFLRNVGQNSAGLAFKVALHAMSPELEQKIQEIADTINKYTQYFQNSCSAAKAIMDAGPGAWINDAVATATGNTNRVGTYQDYGTASLALQNNGGKAIQNATKITSADGVIAEAPEMNITWAAMNAAKLNDLNDDEKGMLLALFGTAVYKATGTSEDSSIAPVEYEVRTELKDLIGEGTGTTSIKIYSCNGDEAACLTPLRVTKAVKPYYALVREQVDSLRNAVINRTTPDLNVLSSLTNKTSFPIYKIILATASNNLAFASQTILAVYSMAIATEIATQYTEEVTAVILNQIKVARNTSFSQKKLIALETLEKRINTLREDSRQKRQEIYQKVAQQATMYDQIQALQRSLDGGISQNLAANMRFGG